MICFTQAITLRCESCGDGGDATALFGAEGGTGTVQLIKFVAVPTDWAIDSKPYLNTYFFPANARCPKCKPKNVP